jgi:hypothetical protein
VPTAGVSPAATLKNGTFFVLTFSSAKSALASAAATPSTSIVPPLPVRTLANEALAMTW